MVQTILSGVETAYKNLSERYHIPSCASQAQVVEAAGAEPINLIPKI